MLSKYLSILAASAAVAFAYTQPTTQCVDKCNPIAHPGLNELVPKGTTYTISWKATTPGTVTILLYTGPAENLALLFPIAEKIENSGTYAWKVPSTLKNDVTHYGIQLIDDADGTFQYSTQFGIGGDSAASTSESSSASASASASASGSTAAPSSSSATKSETAKTAAASTTSQGTVSSGLPSNSTILTASPSISKPSTLDTSAAGTAGASSTGGSAASTTASTAGAAGTIKMSLGGAAVALMAAVAAL